jgi:flagellar basal body P-ring protein FlgI
MASTAHLIGNQYGAKVIVDLKTGAIYDSIEVMAKELNVKSNTICQKIRRDTTGRYLKLNKVQAENYRKATNAESAVLQTN